MGVEREDTGLADDTAATVVDTPGAPSPAEALTIPAELDDRFEHIALLGVGGMGTVHRVRDRALDREAALKLLAEERWRDPSLRTRFLREARAAAKLEHPGIVTIYDVDPEGRFLVMELIGDGSLKDRIKATGKRRPLPIDEVRRIGVELCSALAAAHDAGIIHRDVKPSNLLFAADGAVRLADFGIAHLDDSELTRTGHALGTPAYMAPEQLRAGVVDHRADLYAAGATLFEAATGRRLHGETGRVGDVRRAIEQAGGDPGLAHAIAVATMEKPHQRFASAAEMLAALEPGVEVPAPPSPPASPPVRPQNADTQTAHISTSRRWWAPAILALLMVAGSLVLLAISLGSPGASEPIGPAVSAGRAVSVAILPFDIESRHGELEAARTTLPRVFAEQLADRRALSIITYDRLRAVAGTDSSNDALVGAARQLGAQRLVTGVVRDHDDGTLLLDVVIEDTSGAGLQRFDLVSTVSGLFTSTKLAADIVEDIVTGRAEADLAAGIAAAHSASWERADRHLRAVLGRQPSHPEAHYYLALVSWWSGSRPKQEKTARIEAALEVDQSPARRGVLEGIKLLADERWLGARDHYEVLAKKFPRDRDVLYGLIEGRFHAGDPAGAMAAYSELLTVAPDFRIGLIHAIRYYLTRRDRAMAKKVIGGIDLDSPDRMWLVSFALAFEGPDDARQLIDTLRQRGDVSAAAIAKNAAEIEAIARRPRTAAGLLPNTDQRGHWALAIASGAVERAAALRTATYGNALAVVDRRLRRTTLRQLALVDLGRSLDEQRRQALAELSKSTGSDHEERTEAVRAMLAGSVGDLDQLAIAEASGYPQAVAIARAVEATRQNKLDEAAGHWRRALELNGHGEARIIEFLRLAEVESDRGEHAATLSACSEVIAPGLFSWSWGGAVGPCLVLSIAAARELGDQARAKALFDQLVELRGEASADDPLIREGRAALEP